MIFYVAVRATLSSTISL